MKVLQARSTIHEYQLTRLIIKKELEKRIKVELAHNLATTLVEEVMDDVIVKYEHNERPQFAFPLSGSIVYEARVHLLTDTEYKEFERLKQLIKDFSTLLP